MARNLADDCFRLGLSLRMIHTDSDEFNEETIAGLHGSGEIGDITQLLVVGHGANLNGAHKIMTQCHGPDEDDYVYPVQTDTLKLLGLLRERPEIDPATGKRLLWKGMIHLLSCAAQILSEQIAASAEAQAGGPTLCYGNRDSHGSSESSDAIRSICECVHQHGNKNALSAVDMLAWAARTAAVPVTLAGGEMRSPIEVQPARSVMEAMPSFLPGRLRQLQLDRDYDAARAAADEADLRRVSDAMLRDDGRPDSLVLQQNLARIVQEHVVQDRLDQAAGLFRDAPPLVHTISAFRNPLDAVVEPASLDRYRKLARKASKRGHRSAKVATRAAHKATEKERKTRETQDTVLEAAIRRIAREPGYAATLLQRACGQGDVAMFAALYQASGLALFSQRALVQSSSNQGMPPLHLACLIQAPELVATLLAHGADVNQPDRNGKTALHHAVEVRSLALVKVLASANADATIESDGMTPVALAARTGFDAGFAALANAGFWQALTAGGKPLSARRAAQGLH